MTDITAVISPADLLDTKEAAPYLRMRPQTLNNWRALGKGPKHVRVGGRIFYRRSDLDAFIESSEG